MSVIGQFMSNGYSKSQVFTSSGTWIRPANVTAVFVVLVGGGTNGNAGTTIGGRGGAGGEVLMTMWPVSSNINIVIGAGAAANAGSSSFDGSLIACGARLQYPADIGLASSHNRGTGGDPTGTGHSIPNGISLGAGAPTTTTNGHGGGCVGLGGVQGAGTQVHRGGGGGASYGAGGAGGAGGASYGAGASGIYGSGGGGGGSNSTVGAAGGAGGSGLCIVYWNE